MAAAGRRREARAASAPTRADRPLLPRHLRRTSSSACSATPTMRRVTNPAAIRPKPAWARSRLPARKSPAASARGLDAKKPPGISPRRLFEPLRGKPTRRRGDNLLAFSMRAVEALSCAQAAQGNGATFQSTPVLGKPGDDLLSRVLRRSTIGAGAFHGRVRDGIGCARSASITRPTKDGVKSGPNMLYPSRPAPGVVAQRLPSTSAERGRATRMGTGNESNQADRAISTG